MSVKKWREAYNNIEIADDALSTMAPFPSLFSNDFIVYLQSKGNPDNVVEFVRDMHREMVWVYGNWAKVQRDSDVRRLLGDMINGADGPDYEFTKKFILDYAKANNIALTLPTAEPSWLGDAQAAAIAP